MADRTAPVTQTGTAWSRFQQWRLNAPTGFSWTDDDVMHEKNDSFLNGLIVGTWLACMLFVLASVVL